MPTANERDGYVQSLATCLLEQPGGRVVIGGSVGRYEAASSDPLVDDALFLALSSATTPVELQRFTAE